MTLWTAVAQRTPHFELDLRVARRAAGLDAPPFPEAVVATIRTESSAVGLATLRSLYEAYPDWSILEQRHFERLARGLADDGRESLASELLRIGIERYSESAALWQARGELLLATRDKRGAVAAFETAKRIDPDLAESLLARARAD